MIDSPAPISKVPNVNAPRSASGNLMSSLLQYAGLLGVLALLILIFSLMSTNFLTVRTLTSVANQIPDLTVIAVA